MHHNHLFTLKTLGRVLYSSAIHLSTKLFTNLVIKYYVILLRNCVRLNYVNNFIG